jgi:SAM-dependent methyltransferase
MLQGEQVSENQADWANRLTDMEQWYRDLLALGETQAEQNLLSDYRPFETFLGALRGRVLDIGGGAGLAGRFLPSDVDYHVIDPSPVWSEPEWRDFAASFGARGAAAVRHVGMGEALPFEPASFDAAVAFWSLNHAADPGACVEQIVRVIRPGGKVLLVLEDMIPSWRDIVQFGIGRARYHFGGGHVPYPEGWGQPEIESAAHGALRKLAGTWPLQADHIRLTEREVARHWGSSLRLVARRWQGGFLSLELQAPR